MIRRWTLGVFSMAVVFLSGMLASNLAREPASALIAGPFTFASSDGTPAGWRRKDFKNQSRFAIIEEDQMPVLRAESNAAASGLFREIMADPKQFPVVRWRWKVSRVVATANERQKRGDDAAVRVFVLFKDPLPGASAFSKFKHKLAAATGAVSPGVALCYIWSNRLPKGQAARSPYTDWVGVIAVEQGSERAGAWVTVERNLVEDFRRVFGTEPKQVVGIAVMTDTDDTGESVTAFYGNIIFDKAFSKPGASVGKQPPDPLPTAASSAPSAVKSDTFK